MNNISKDKSMEKRMAVIYEITYNGRKYIGSAFDFNRRKYMHYWMLKRNEHSNPILQNVFNNMPSNEDLEWNILEENISQDNLYEVEQKYLDELFKLDKDKIFNVSDKARHPRVTGWKHSEEYKKKMSNLMTGKKKSTEARKNMSNTKKELWKNPEYKKKMSEAAKRRPSNRKGVKLSAETKAKISASKLGTKYKKSKKFLEK